MGPYVTLASIAFVSNVPCGFLRQGFRKFSLSWFFWIHATIPVLIYLRVVFGVSAWFVPVSILMAVAGQFAGGRLRRQLQLSHSRVREGGVS